MDIHGENIGAAGKVKIGTQINNFSENKQSLPNTIPSTISFVGREDYLTDLHEAYQNGTRCFNLHGIGGVGKTSLVLQFASEIADNFESKIFVDMQGMSKNPYSWRDAMFEITRQFNPEIRSDISDNQLKSTFIQLVQNQSTLIILDTAENKQSVELLKQANACFITTSRQSFVLTGGKSLAIEKMLPEDARKLLFTIAEEQRFEDQADKLASLAGHLPMALKPLASILKEDELETIEELIERYSDKKELLKERVPDYNDLTIQASFELSYEKLSDEMKQNWRRLSVFPADFEEKAISYVLNISDVDAKEIQRQLRSYSLLEANPKTRRFNLHDLARVFTDEKLSGNERFSSQILFAKYYVLMLWQFQQMQIKEEKNYYTKVLTLLDTEWHNITAGQIWTSEFGNNLEKANICTEYSLSAQSFLSLRLNPRQHIEWYKSGLYAAQKIKDKNKEGIILGNIGSVYDQLGENLTSIQYYEQAIAILHQVRDFLNEGFFIGNLGVAYKNLGKYKKAIRCCRQSLTLCQKNRNRRGEGNSLGNLGNIFYLLGGYKRAIEYHKKALAISLETNDLKGEETHSGNLGNCYLVLKDFPKTTEYYQHALRISRQIKNQEGESRHLINLGEVHQILGENDLACDLWKEALPILKNIESPRLDFIQQHIKENCRN